MSNAPYNEFCLGDWHVTPLRGVIHGPAGTRRITPKAMYVFRCDRMPSDMAVQCQRRGDRAVFDLHVGAGDRMFAVRVTGANGDQEITDPQILRE